MGSCLSVGGISEQSFQSHQCFDCSLYASQGKRDAMEDRNVICLTLSKHPSYSLIGVFDGFNGADASTFMSENIVKTLDSVNDLEDNDAIIEAIHQMDDDWIHSKHQKHDEAVPNVNPGCTFVLGLINTGYRNSHSSIELELSSPYSPHSSESSPSPSVSSQTPEYEQFVEGKGYKVRIFWAGDSRAMLMSHECKFQNLTHDHNCAAEEEATRIISAHGTITNGRVDGICELTRGFGCYPMKNNADLPSNKQKMIVDPDDTSLFCTHGDTLLLFCDGVYKNWSDAQLQKRYKHHHLQQEDEKKGLMYSSMYLAEQARDEGSKDNITIVALKFK